MNRWVDGLQDRIYENNLDTVHPDMVLTNIVLTIKAIHTIKQQNNSTNISNSLSNVGAAIVLTNYFDIFVCI